MTTEILERSTDSYIPRMAVVVYSNKNDEYYLESHSIDEKGRLNTGCPLTEDCISDIASSFSIQQSVTPHGIVPSNMLYFDTRKGNDKYIWYNPPCKQQMFFNKQLKIKDGEYYIPGIIYQVIGDSLNVYAFKGNKPKNKLFRAPFFNVSESSVCIGAPKIDYPKNPSFIDFIRYWEKKFWLTEFSHLGSGGNPVKGNLVLVTKESKERFDTDLLLPIKTTLKNLLR